MKIPGFIFTCTACGGETAIDFHHLSFSRTYTCSVCNQAFKISKRQGLSISKQLEDYAARLPDDELGRPIPPTGGLRYRGKTATSRAH